MKPTIAKIKDFRGRIRGYRATLGAIEADASTPQEATALCEAMALASLENQGAVTVMHDLYPDKRGIRTTWILEYRHGHWGYRMARPMRPGFHADGHSSCGLSSQCAPDRYAAENKMRAHWYAINVEPFVALLVAIGALASAGSGKVAA